MEGKVGENEPESANSRPSACPVMPVSGYPRPPNSNRGLNVFNPTAPPRQPPTNKVGLIVITGNRGTAVPSENPHEPNIPSLLLKTVWDVRPDLSARALIF